MPPPRELLGSVEEVIWEAYEHHFEKSDELACACGFVPQWRGSLGGDILFQHVSGAVSDAAIAEIERLWKD